MVDLQRTPNYEALVRALIEKTKVGRLRWEETAVENAFLTSAKGVQTFEIRRVDLADLDLSAIAPPPDSSPFGDRQSSVFSNLRELDLGAQAIVLTVRDRNGEVEYQYVERTPSGFARELFDMARRLATKVDEKVDASVELVKGL